MALLLLLDNPASYGQVYNIGSQREVTIRGLAELVISRTGSSSPIELVPYDQAYSAGFEDMYRRMPDTEAITRLTGWQPELSLETIIDDVAASLRRNEVG